ncbi:MAG: hypothetical protein ACE5GQ_01400 [Nitrospinales bacterium]
MKNNDFSVKKHPGLKSGIPLATALFVLATFATMPASHAVGTKVKICHRSGGAQVTLEVDVSGAYSGHIPNHSLDTLGSCTISSNSNNSGVGFDTPVLDIKEFREQ